MNRNYLRQFTHNACESLTLNNNFYKQWVFRFTFLELEKDLAPNGDITTSTLFSEDKKINVQIIANESGLIAGLDEIKYFLLDSSPTFRPSLKGEFNIEFNFKDGDKFKKNDKILTLSGKLTNIFAIERIVLNLLSRMSGVATFTNKILSKIEKFDVLLCPTRKTLWGLLDKKAVCIGGGGTHRLNLSDSILVKDNHLNAMNRDFSEVLRNIEKSKLNCRFYEIEVETPEEAIKIAGFISKLKKRNSFKMVPVIMFDNFTALKVKQTILTLKQNNLFDFALFEASGGINENNILDYASTGIDILSLGCLTGGVKGIDFSMELSMFESGFLK